MGTWEGAEVPGDRVLPQHALLRGGSPGPWPRGGGGQLELGDLAWQPGMYWLRV